MSGIAFVFPGQGAQAVGMGLGLFQGTEEAKAVFAEADEALGFSLSNLCFKGPAEDLKQTDNAQPAILTASIAAYRALAARSIVRPQFVAGHSLGEYSALVAAGVLSFADAVRLVRTRGALMAAAQTPGAGTMAAVLSLSAEVLQPLLAASAAAGVVEMANLNCPGQVVVSGETNAVAACRRLAEEAGATVMPLQVSGAFHSSLMRTAAEKFAETLNGVKLNTAQTPVVANVTAQPVTGPDTIRRLLVEQIQAPVRWEESIRYMLGADVKTFIELGPGRVLSGLIKRIDRSARIANIGDEMSLKETLAILGEV